MGVVLYRREACKFSKKEYLSQVFSCEFYEISKNTFFLQNTSGGCSFQEKLRSGKSSWLLRRVAFTVEFENGFAAAF